MNQTRWYDKSFWVYLSFMCPPVALYALYRNSSWDKEKKRKFFGYALILVALQIVVIVFGPTQKEREARHVADELEANARDAAKKEKQEALAATSEAREKSIADADKERIEFLVKYRGFGAPKIMYQCGKEIGYSVGVGINATYNHLVKEAREKCEQYDWDKGKFKLLEGQQ